jgi:predicted NBD/HSP70 family sugar kinase
VHYITLSQMANPTLQHKINQSAVFHYLREHGPAYKKQIAQALQISIPSVTRALDALIERGFSEQIEHRKSKQQRTVPYYAITIQDAVIIAMDVLKRTIVARNLEETFPVKEFTYNPEKPLIDEFAQIITTYVAADLGRKVSDIASICIGLPGIVNVEKGIVEKAIYHRELEHVQLKKLLSQAFSCSVFIDNVVNLAAYANYCEIDKKFGNIVACDIGIEVGAGLVINHRIYRGENHIAGETSFFIDDLRNPSENCKETCTFQSLSSLIERSPIYEAVKTAPAYGEYEPRYMKNIAGLFALAHEEHQEALDILDAYIVRVVLMINKIEILLNPKKIFIGGDVCSLPHSREVFLDRLNALYQPIQQVKNPVRYSQHGRNITLYGASEMGLEVYLKKEFPYILK